MTFIRRRRFLLLALTALLAANAGRAEGLVERLSQGQAGLELRYRYEYVDQQGFDQKANASTLRGRLNWSSGRVNDFDFFFELDSVTTLLVDDYNSGAGTSSPRRDRYPVVADPDYTEVNQVYLQYHGSPGQRLRVGRQRILLDNQRFIGGVGWRQNEQTYDAVSFKYAPENGPQLFYAWVGNVNRIFGDDVPAGDHESSTHLLNGSYPIGTDGTLAGYYYAIDNDDAPEASTNTVGARFTNKVSVGGFPLDYAVEYAWQRDRTNNPVNFTAHYLRLDGALKLAAMRLLAGYELLQGNRNTVGAAFRTPLATLHAFNGWADQFLATPDSGLTDAFLGVSGNAGNWTWQAVMHLFDSEASSASFGTELDLAASRKFGALGLSLKAARFESDNPALSDVTRLWLMLSLPL